MARSSKPGDSFPLSVVRKENSVPENVQNDVADAADVVKDTASKAMAEIAEQIKALREQVQTLQATTSEIASQAGKVVASSARVASDKVTEGARIAGDKAVAEAKVASERVSSTVEAYPISAVLIASVTAFLLGRISASAHSQPTYTEGALDQLKQKLHDLSGRLPPHLKSALRSSLR
jgi:ElaB/YqjD/DUF883 family membrane-anchored ribosome-binding protein